MNRYMEVHKTLVGSKMLRDGGRLYMPGLDETDYEALYEYIVSILYPPSYEPDFFGWLRIKALQYFKYRRKRKFNPLEDSDPLCTLPPEELDTRQQLSILKWYVGKMAYKDIKEG